MMASPVCIKLHNIKMVKIKYEGKLYEVATSSFDNLLSDFQKHKPEVKQLLYARPLMAEDFENLTEESIVYASGDTMSIIEGSLQENSETYCTGLPQLEYRNTSVNQNGHCMAGMATTLLQPDASKLRSDLSMVDSFCSPPSVFIEAPPETDPIDTVDVARRVREVLERHKISQTLFSKYVIKRSQGTTSDLLRCPKQWERMSEEGRVPYRRMKAWLEGDLQHNLQVLLRIKQGIYNHVYNHTPLCSLYDTRENILCIYFQACLIIMNYIFTGLDIPALPPKCNRTKFTDEQKEALESFLTQNPRLTHDTLEQFAHEQNLTISAVRNWVNNRKQRMKRGSSTGFEESPGKYPRSDGSDDLDDGGFQTRPQDFESSGFHAVETEGVPTMVNSAPYDQGRVPQTVGTEFEATRVTTEFDESSFNGVGSTSVADVSAITTPLKQENDGKNQCEYDSSTNVTVECLGTD
jgi:hypothetical protein